MEIRGKWGLSTTKTNSQFISLQFLRNFALFELMILYRLFHFTVENINFAKSFLTWKISSYGFGKKGIATSDASEDMKNRKSRQKVQYCITAIKNDYQTRNDSAIV